jgi:hypothetical protein
MDGIVIIQEEDLTYLTGAGGAFMQEYGKALFNIKIKSYETKAKAIVANIGSDVLLGYYLLSDRDRRSADLLLSKKRYFS